MSPTNTDPDFKHSTRCQQTKARTEFNIDRSRKDGLHGYCRDCQRAYINGYRKDRAVRAARRSAGSRNLLAVEAVKTSESVAMRPTATPGDKPTKQGALGLVLGVLVVTEAGLLLCDDTLTPVREGDFVRASATTGQVRVAKNLGQQGRFDVARRLLQLKARYLAAIRAKRGAGGVK